MNGCNRTKGILAETAPQQEGDISRNQVNERGLHAIYLHIFFKWLLTKYRPLSSNQMADLFNFFEDNRQ